MYEERFWDPEWELNRTTVWAVDVDKLRLRIIELEARLEELEAPQ